MELLSACDFTNAATAKKSLRSLTDRANRTASWITNSANAAVSKGVAVRHRSRPGRHNNIELFNRSVAMVGISHEIVSAPEGVSIITRRAIAMSNQLVEATELLDAAEQLFETQVKKFNDASDKAVASAKQRVSQLNDYNNRLAVALGNLNKTLGDEKMGRALESAEKLVTALTLLDKLEASGNLKRIIDALA